MKRADDVIVQGCSWCAGRAGALRIGLAVIWMAAPRIGWGQWNGTNPLWTNSSVGIGTASPLTKLYVSDQSITAAQTIGVFSAPSLANDNRLALFVGRNYGIIDDAAYIGFTPSATSGAATLNLGFYGSNNLVNIHANGNVGIGTTAPQYRLAVNGTIGAKDVMVTNSGWPDYVFRPGYRLRPLSEVGAYIRAHRHLPDIPSEQEVKEKGVSVGEMQARLLAKIEELTLHLIQQEKENRELRERVARLETRAAGR